MKAFVVILALTVALVVAADEQQAPAIDLSCSGLCNAGCNIADGVCRLFMTDVCDTNLATCTSNCQMYCGCMDTCQGRCQKEFNDCKQDDDIVDELVCTTTDVECQSACPVSCELKSGEAAIEKAVENVEES